MASSKSAQKRIRQNIKRRSVNRWRLRIMRDAIKDVHDKLAHGTPDEAHSAFLTCQKVIDRTAQKGVIHKNQAARRVSRLSAKVRARRQAAGH
ncbi:MAG: 30S ribosomal protein S20 [Phycisphaeraceae bacterium]|nr:30S ribosomal protein S20 [Phycisphaeraceae bacterium]